VNKIRMGRTISLRHVHRFLDRIVAIHGHGCTRIASDSRMKFSVCLMTVSWA
jgi:hypothetical protein